SRAAARGEPTPPRAAARLRSSSRDESPTRPTCPRRCEGMARPCARTRRRSRTVEFLRLSFLCWRAGGAHQILLADFVDVELRRLIAHRLEHFVDRRRLALRKTQRVDARDDERPQIRAREAPVAEALHDVGDFFFERFEDARGLLARLDRLFDRLGRETLGALQDGTVRAAREAAVLFVNRAERDERGLFEEIIEGRFDLVAALLEE